MRAEALDRGILILAVVTLVGYSTVLAGLAGLAVLSILAVLAVLSVLPIRRKGKSNQHLTGWPSLAHDLLRRTDSYSHF
jgi:hypothetical protein